MIDNWFKKGLAFAIILLFIGVSFQPLIAEETVSVEKTSDYENYSFEEAKEYLFQTIVDISNNPEVKEFLNEHKRDLITNNNDNYDCRNAFQKIYSQNPRLLKSVFFNKPEITVEYYETSYNRGLEIMDILGKEESSKFIEYVSTTNPELLDELKNIILNDKELSNRVSVLEEMNNNLISNLPFEDYSVWICFILDLLVLVLLPIIVINAIIGVGEVIFPFIWRIPIIVKILMFIYDLTIFIIAPIIFLEYKYC